MSFSFNIVQLEAFSVLPRNCILNKIILDLRFFSREWFQLITAVVAVGLVIALIAGTKLKISSNERSAEDKKDFIFAAAYSFGAVLAGTAGIIMALAMQASTPNLGSNYLIYILCIFAAISATRLAQSKLGVLSIAAGTAFILAVFTLALNIVGVTVYIQYSMLASFAFLLTLFMVLSRKNPISILGNE